MKKILHITILLLSAYSTGFASPEPNTSWAAYKNSNSIMGFILGDTEIKDIVAKMGGKLPNEPDHKHELASICYKVGEKPVYVVFSTGVLHDYSTLYGFEVAQNIQDHIKTTCTKYNLSGNESIVTNGGLHIGQTKDSVLEQLNNPTKKSSQNWSWTYENYLKYEKPKVSTTKAGPTDEKYLMKHISKGAYESGTISILFSNETVVGFSVDYFAESDFKIERYDLTSGERLR